MVSFDGNIDRCLKRSISTALLDHNSRSYHNLILARRRSSPGRMSSFAASSSGIHRAVLTRPNVSSRQRLRQATEASLPSSGRSTRPIITKVQRGIPQSSVRSLDGSTCIVVKAPLNHREDKRPNSSCTLCSHFLSLQKIFPYETLFPLPS